jgi:hypothetical protein
MLFRGRLKMKKVRLIAILIFITAVSFLLPVFRASGQGKKARFQGLYDDVYQELMDPANNPDLLKGQVSPEYGDAYVYVPGLFYQRAITEGYSVKSEELEIADAFVERYDEYLSAFAAAPFKSLMQDFDVVMHAYIGIGGVYLAYAYRPDEDLKAEVEKYLDTFEVFVKLAYPMMYYAMEPYGPTTPLAGLAAFYLQYPMTFGRDSEKARHYEKLGFKLLEKMDRHLWCEKEGKYLYSIIPGYKFTYVYSNATMVQALVRAYYLTRDEKYLERARVIMETLHQDLFHLGYEGYLAAEDNCRYRRQYKKVGDQYNREYMALSGNNYMAFAYLLLYEASGFKDQDMLRRAELCIQFAEKWLWDHEGKVQHHIERGILSEPDRYCAGCNFQLLYNIFLYQCALEKKQILLK